MKLPDCMMPDGAEPCAAFQEREQRIRELEEAIRRHMQITQLEASATGAIARGTDHDLWFTLEDVR